MVACGSLCRFLLFVLSRSIQNVGIIKRKITKNILLMLKEEKLMCSIMGYMGSVLTKEEFKEHFDKTISRGPDMQRIIEIPGGIMGFERLSIMGLDERGMQPFNLNNNNLVCNGEVYGFRPLKEELISKGYTFTSDSDCEILLPMYEEYGVEMFKMLDAEYACIIFDAKKNALVAAL